MKKIISYKKYIFMFFVLSFLVLLFIPNTKLNKFVSSINTYFENNGNPREKYSFNADWKFALGEGTYDANSNYNHYCVIGEINNCIDAYSNPDSNTYEEVTNLVNIDSTSEHVYLNSFDVNNDNRFSNVSLPHTYNDVDSFDNYTEGVGAQHGDRSIYTGSAWYKKSFIVTQEQIDNESIYLEFEGAREAMKVYLNGVLLDGENNDEMYENGFIPVGYDLNILDSEGENLLVAGTNYLTVMVDNSYPYYLDGTNSPAIWSDSHWHPNYGGLYRDVNIYFVDKLHLTLPLYSFLKGEGTYVYASDITLDLLNNTSANIHVDTQVENKLNTTQSFDIVSEIYDMSGALVNNATARQNAISLNSGEKRTINLVIPMTNIIRWSDDYPYMYTVKTFIKQGDTIIDNNSEKLGVKTFKITNDAGFYLNQNYTELNGWGQKSTMEWAGLGSAYPDWMTDYVIKLMKDANANYIRFGHTAGSPKQIEYCDKYGIMVTQPGVDAEGNYHQTDNTVLYNGGSYDQNSLLVRAKAFRDMLIYYRNSPSIIMWEIANKGGISTLLNSTSISKIDSFETDLTSASIYKVLADMVDFYDYGNRADTIINVGTYETAVESNIRLITMREAVSGSLEYLDVSESTIGGLASTTTKPVIEGEYNRYESPRRVWDSYTESTSSWTAGGNTFYYNSEDYAKSQISGTVQGIGQTGILNVTNHVGGANWIFSDSTSHGRVTSEVARASGEVDAVMLPKDAYYVNQVIFDKDPSIHIVGHWNYPVGTIKDIIVAANNVDHVKLFVNSVEQTNYSYVTKQYNFEDVSWESGTILAIGYDKNGVELIRDSITSHGIPAGIKITQVGQSPDGLLANGSDILLLDVEVIDSNGNRCVTYDGISADEKVYFTFNESANTAVWRGGYNSSIERSTNKKELYLEAGINRIALKTTLTSGLINVTASTTINGVTYTDTISETSNSISNINGFTTLNSPVLYNIGTISDPSTLVGDGSKFGLGYDIEAGSTMITSLKYYGTKIKDNSIETNFGNGVIMYNDEVFTFTSIPRKLYNAEFLLLPNADKNKELNSLITLKAKKSIYLYVLHDSNISVPSWLSNTSVYTLMTDTVVGGNGVVYALYKTSLNTNDIISIGSTNDTTNSGNANIVLFKEQSKVNNTTFFFEDFSEVDEEALYTSGGWDAVDEDNSGSSVVLEKATIGEKTSLHLIDTNSSKMGYVQRSFAPLSGKFKVFFKAYLPSFLGENYNKYLRIWLSDGKISDDTDKSSLGVESYLYGSTSNGVYLVGVTGVGDNNVIETTNATNALSYGVWHEFEINVDVPYHNYTIKEVGSERVSSYTFLRSGINKLDTITIGTWKSKNSNFNVTDIRIIPIGDSLVTDVSINGERVSSFSQNAYHYSISNIDENSVLTLSEDEDCVSSSYVYDPANDQIILTVMDVYNNEFVYYFVDSDVVDLLSGYSIKYHTSNSTTTNVEQEIFQGEEALHFIDSNSSGMVWIEKSIVHSDYFKVSFDTYLVHPSTDPTLNKFIRVWLTNSPNIYAATTAEKTSSVALLEYLDRNDLNSTFTTKTEVLGTATINTGVNPLLNTWYHFEITVDDVLNKYSVNITNPNNPSETYSYSDKSINDVGMNYLVIGTGNSSTNDFYFKNINVENIIPDPLEGISIDDESLILYSNRVTNYDSTIMLSNSTEVILTGSDIVNPIIEKDLNNSEIIITYSDVEGNEFTYTIIYNYMETVTATMLTSKKADITTLLTSHMDDYLAESLQPLYETYIEVNGKTIGELTDAQLSTYYDEFVDNQSNLLPKNLYTKYLEDMCISEALLHNYNIGSVLEKDNITYKNGSDTFYSIPKKYQNADYFLLENNDLSLLSDTLHFTGNAAINLSVLVFRDIRAGVVSESGFSFTGDIVTSSDGIVYKIYRKDYLKDSEVDIDVNTLINNKISNYNSIVAIKSKYELDNNEFFAIDFNEHDSHSLINFVNGLKSDSADTITLIEQDGESVMKLATTSTTSLPFTFMRFAKQNDKFDFSMSVYLYDLTSSSNYVNRFNRIWFTKDYIEEPSVIETNNTKTNFVSIETYIDRSSNTSLNYEFMYRKNGVNNSSYYVKKNTNNWYLSKLNWNSFSYNIDANNHNMTITYDDYTSENLSFYKNFDYINILSLTGRKNERSDMLYKNINIVPKEKELLNSISINSHVVNNYSSVTNDYLYESADNTYDVTYSLGVNGLQSNIGQLVSDANTTISYTPVSVDSVLNHKIYYSKNYIEDQNDYRYLLTIKIEEAMQKDESIYTSASWNNLQVALSAGITQINNLNSTLLEMKTAYINLCNAIDNLEILGSNDFTYEYIGDLYVGSDVNNNISVIKPYITNDSSFVFKTSISGNISGSVDFSSYNINRKLVFDTTIPVGTFITMIDLSNGLPNYYYYEVINTHDEIHLSNFISMDGSDRTFSDTWNYDSENNTLTDSYIFIIDFKDSDNNLSSNTYRLNFYASTDFETESGYKYITSLNKYFYISESSPSYSLNIDNMLDRIANTSDISFDLIKSYNDIIVDSNSIINTNYTNKQIGVKISILKDDNSEYEDVMLPQGTKICIESNCYYTTDNYNIIVPLINNSTSMTIDFGDYELLEDATYVLKTDLFMSEGDNPGMVLASNSGFVNIYSLNKKSFKVTSDNLRNNIISFEDHNSVRFNFLLDSNEYVLAPIITLRAIRVSDGSAIDINNYVSNSLSVYNANDYSYNLGRERNYTLNLNGLLPRGTYKLIFDLYDRGIYQNTEYEYIIIK